VLAGIDLRYKLTDKASIADAMTETPFLMIVCCGYGNCAVFTRVVNILLVSPVLSVTILLTVLAILYFCAAQQ